MTFSLTPYHGIFTAAPTGQAAHKPDFAQVPQRIGDDLCRLAGAGAIVAVSTVAGGVSASASFILTFDNGRRLFVKGSHPGDQSHGAANLRGECMAYRNIDLLRDCAPPFCGMVHADHGDDNGWWLGAWEAVETSASAYNADALFAMLDDVQRYEVPAQAGLAVASAHPYLSQFMTDTYKWQRLRGDAQRAQKFAQCFDDAPAALQWLSANSDKLCALQARASTFAWRLGLMHGDLRCDNYIYGALPASPARWYMIDWANAADGPLAFDRVMLAASLCAQGACTVTDALAFAQGDLDAEEIRLMLVMQAGYFADQIYRAPPAAMPRLRPVQKAMFAGLLALLDAAEVVAAPPAGPLAQ